MQVKAGTRSRVEPEQQGSACAIYVADELGAADVRTWRLKVFADNRFVGEITTRTPPAPPGTAVPPLPADARGRMVAMACSPGATRWVVEVDYGNDGPPTPAPKADVYVTAGDLPLEPGLRPVNERSRYTVGSAAGVVQIPRGQRVWSWAAFSNGAGCTVDINGQGAIPIPIGGAVRGEPAGLLDGAVFTFVGGLLGGYFIEWKET
jgi:hypothetical protein